VVERRLRAVVLDSRRVPPTTMKEARMADILRNQAGTGPDPDQAGGLGLAPRIFPRP